MWDQHMHCMFSGDSDADPVLMIKSAINKGLDGICFTDHLDYDYKEEPGLFDLDIAAYEKRIKRLAIVLKEKGCPLNIHWALKSVYSLILQTKIMRSPKNIRLTS